MQGERLEEFKKHPDFQAWQKSLHSCMLVLAGYNNESVYSTRECWLSSIALDMIERVKESRQSEPYAYILGLQEEDKAFPRVLSCIVLQLLLSSPQVLQNDAQYAELCAEIEAYSAATKSEQEYSNISNVLLEKVALRILNLFDRTKTVWIILDRVDQCNPGKKGHRRMLMRTLVHLIQKATVTVKVLAVVNGYDWRVDEEGDELEQDRDAHVIIHQGRQGIY